MNKNDVENIALILDDAKNKGVSGFDWWLERLSELDERIADNAEFFFTLQNMENFMDDEIDRLMVEKFGHHWSIRKSISIGHVKEAREEAELTARKKFFPEEFEDE